MIATITHAVRSLRHAPGLALAAILCIALGTAATTTVATLVSATLIRPVPFPAPERLVRVWFDEPQVNSRISLSIPEIADFGAMTAFDAFLGTARVRSTVLFDSGAERLRGEGVSRGYFETLGIRPALGRVLQPADHTADAPAVVVLSHDTWLRHFGGDAAVVGRPFRTPHAAYTIVGVAQRGFEGTVEDDVVEFFIPLEQYEPRALRTDRNARPSWAIGRLRPGASIGAAQAEAERVHQALAAAHPDIYRRWQVRVEPFGESWRERLRGSGAVLFAAAALLLMIAAINVGCLLLARVLDRRRELAIRAALGAGTRRIALQLFTEALVLVVAGGALGALLGPRLLDGFLAVAPLDRLSLPRYLRLEPDATALAIAIGTLAVAGLLAGTVPMLLGRRVQPADVLRDGGRGHLGRGAEKGWGAALIASETALTLVLLVTGGLLVRSYERLTNIDTGFERDRIARLAVTLSRSDYGEAERLPQVYERLQRELANVPGVRAIGLVSPTLPPWDGLQSRVHPEGVDLPTAGGGVDEGIVVSTHLADGGLLPMLGGGIVAGRNLDQGDARADAASLVVISRSLAKLMGGPEKALGRTVTFGPDDPGMPTGPFRVVGVAEDMAYDGLVEQDTRRFVRGGAGGDARASRFDVYVSLQRFPSPVVSIGAATSGDPAALITPLRARIAAIAPASAIHWVGTMPEEIAAEYAPTRFYTILVTVFSTSALLLTSLGLFALLSHAAVRRTSEMGLRLALGASRGSTARLLLRGGLSPIAAGIAAGGLGAYAVGRSMGGMVYGIGTFDSATFALSVAVLALVSVCAGLVPARRIASIDPVAALRTD